MKGNVRAGFAVAATAGTLFAVAITAWAQNLTVNGKVGIGTTPTTNKLDVAGTASAQDLTVSGKVGIGTTSPVTKLDIAGTGTVGTYSVTNSGVIIRNSAGTELTRFYASDPDLDNDFNSANLYIGFEAGLANRRTIHLPDSPTPELAGVPSRPSPPDMSTPVSASRRLGATPPDTTMRP